MSSVDIPVPDGHDVKALCRFLFLDGPYRSWRHIHRHPKLWAGVLAYAGLTALVGAADATYALYLPVLALPWKILHGSSYRRWCSAPIRSDWRRWFRYQRSWTNVTALNRLSVINKHALDVHPDIVKVRCEGHSRTWHWSWRWPLIKRVVTCTDQVWVRTLISQIIDDYQDRTAELARDYGARSCRAFDADKGRVRLEFSYGPDPLADTIPALPIPATADEIDLTAIPVGRTERGDVWTLPILGSHTLVAGITSSGKSSLTWSMLRGLAPAIQAGTVIVWAIDPKGSMELGPGRALFDRFCCGTVPEMADLLADAVKYMDARTCMLEEATHTPTVQHPFLLVVVDEWARISRYKGDKTTAAIADTAMEALVNVGRAPGVGVWICTQSPLKEVVRQRDEIPNAIGFRMLPRIYNNFVLGTTAHSQGADCAAIPRSMPGVGWIREEDGSLARVRAAYVPRDEIRAMAAKYGRTPVLAGEWEPSGFDAEADAFEDDMLELLSGEVVAEEVE